MERRAALAMLVLSIRTNVRKANLTLEELNRGVRQKTYESTLARCFRTIEHDARVVGLERLADFIGHAKDLGGVVQSVQDVGAAVELLDEAGAELMRVADHIESGQRHELDKGLALRLKKAAPPPKRIL